jgi:hypothetical protein
MPSCHEMRARSSLMLSDAPLVLPNRSVIQAQKAAKRKQQTMVTAGLRGDDYLPPEILSNLPSGTAQPSGGSSSAAGEAAGGKRLTKAEAKAAARRQEAEELAKRREPHQLGLPRVVRKGETVEVAVLPPTEGGVGGMRAARLQAPIKQDARAFLQQQLYGQRHTRVSAATLASQRPASGRFGAASNFATVPLDAKPTGVTKKGKQRGKEKPRLAGTSTLEQMAAAIMRKKR